MPSNDDDSPGDRWAADGHPPAAAIRLIKAIGEGVTQAIEEHERESHDMRDRGMSGEALVAMLASLVEEHERRYPLTTPSRSGGLFFASGFASQWTRCSCSPTPGDNSKPAVSPVASTRFPPDSATNATREQFYCLLPVCGFLEPMEVDPGGDTPGDLIEKAEVLRAKLREARKHGLSPEEQASIKDLLAAIDALLRKRIVE